MEIKLGKVGEKGVGEDSSKVKMKSTNVGDFGGDGADEQVRLQRVAEFLRDINLGRLSSVVRRNKLTFDRIQKLTDLEWREFGIEKTEVKLIKQQMAYYIEQEEEEIEHQALEWEQKKASAANKAPKTHMI